MVEAERMRVCVIGTGYLGATTAACLAEMGFEVLGLDVDEAKVDMLRSGKVPFYEPGLEDLLKANLRTDRLHFTTSFAEAAEFADLHLICVGTPQRDDSGAADLRYVNSAVDNLAPHLTRPTVVVGRSTVPVGTAATLAARLAALAPVGEEAELGWSPEFLREGFGVEDTLRPNRIVIGTESPRVEKAVRALWQQQVDDGTPFLVTDLQTAELVKVSANAFLATKISFINAMAEVSEVAGADVIQLAEALSYDDRIGGKFLGPGLGFGGGCLPKDIRAFMARAEELGVDEALGFLREVDSINDRRRDHVITLATDLLDGQVAGKHVAVLGAAFKPDTDDMRNSPALDIAARLAAKGAHITITDPQAGPVLAAQNRPDLTVTDTAEEAITGADLVLLLTEWRQFRDLDPTAVVHLPNRPAIIDGRNVLDPQQWRSAGWTYHGMGRP